MSTKRPTKRRPTHPGAILREDVLPALDITQTEFARLLGVSRLTVSELLHEKRALSPDMALRLSRLLSTSPERAEDAADAGHLGARAARQLRNNQGAEGRPALRRVPGRKRPEATGLTFNVQRYNV